MKKLISILTVLSLLLLCACGEGEGSTSSSSVVDEAPIDESSAIILSEGEIPSDISVTDTAEMEFDVTNRDKEFGYNESDVREGSYEGNVLKITAEGTYVLSGDMTDKMVLVSAPESAKVQLVLDNVSIKNSNGPAIYVKSADKVFITTKEGTENTVSDGESYTYMDSGDKIEAAIYSKCDLTVNGLGSLSVNGMQKHGIVSKDELSVVLLTLSVNAKNVALHGKDCVRLLKVNGNIVGQTDAIRSDNSQDKEWGFVYIDGGKLDIFGGNDGIQAETVVRIDDGEISIFSGEGSDAKYTDDESRKGIKASADILINGGKLSVDSADDAIHSNNTICIADGELNLSSGDDAIHADSDFSVANGKIDIKKSYEGIEARRILITGGDISLTASDDGLNAAGGNDDTTNAQRPGKDGFSGGNGAIAISGGNILIDALGDGIDSNGTITVSGGIVLVSGPTNNGNSAFDFDGNAFVTGGTLVALGSTGMAQGFTSAENQGAMFLNLGVQEAGTSFAVVDSEGNCVASFTPKKGYQSAVVTSPKIVQGGTYSYIVGGTAENADENGFADSGKVSGGTNLGSVTMDSLIYGTGGFGGFGGMGGHGGKPNGDFGGKGNREDFSRPDGFSKPDDFSVPEGMNPPDGFGGVIPPEIPSSENSVN